MITFKHKLGDEFEILFYRIIYYSCTLFDWKINTKLRNGAKHRKPKIKPFCNRLDRSQIHDFPIRECIYRHLFLYEKLLARL